MCVEFDGSRETVGSTSGKSVEEGLEDGGLTGGIEDVESVSVESHPGNELA